MAAKSARKKAARGTPSEKYTRPELRERLKKRIQAGDRGGRAGEWSARKSQLLVQEYKKAGGGFRGPKEEKQKSLEKWTAEEWQTKEGGTRARTGSTTKRYLPKKAWEQLSEPEKRSTEKTKRAGSRGGKQFVRNTAAAKQARKRATAPSSHRSAPRAM